MRSARSSSAFFFFNDTATTEIYTLSLHDALPISFLAAARWRGGSTANCSNAATPTATPWRRSFGLRASIRSEEHTSELQSHLNIACPLLLEKKTDESRCTTTCWYSPLNECTPPRL